ncbi:hypothetical protein [Spiroplasma sp. SV19]|uniref:hypothetical protein n=1 Tax=Spiroplasma sp. SV19 TaxID=2570468 RepID=UPI0024B81D70|nr:hypothetical protein [Spiroplasma sp. SV19]WHQ37471.1 hypothetical protein E7Y35_06460 [Spiroplasma sp. SV19]
MKKLLCILSVATIGVVAPLNIVETNKVIDKDKNIAKNYLNNFEDKLFPLFLENLINEIKIFLIKKPELQKSNNNEIITAFINYQRQRIYQVLEQDANISQTTAFETFWWGFKWWITWESFKFTLNKHGYAIARDSITGISVTKMGGYVISYLAIKFPKILLIPKIGLIAAGVLGTQVAGCLLGRQFWVKKGIIFRMLWVGIMTGCWDQ